MACYLISPPESAWPHSPLLLVFHRQSPYVPSPTLWAALKTLPSPGSSQQTGEGGGKRGWDAGHRVPVFLTSGPWANYLVSPSLCVLTWKTGKQQWLPQEITSRFKTDRHQGQVALRPPSQWWAVLVTPVCLLS